LFHNAVAITVVKIMQLVEPTECIFLSVQI